MATIKPIEGKSVGVVIGPGGSGLLKKMKELLENSLDAGATCVEVRFKNNGLDLIEVQDNGSGIAKEDYESIALKHYTSKLSSFDDLTSLKTFGFRGEALSSLCALSDLHIITAREDEAPRGTRLDFETSGKLKETQVIASQRGTTVAVETIFKNLPVRRQELEKNIKRDVNVKFTVSNILAKGKKVAVFSTQSNKTTRENVANVYGAKTLTALIGLDLTFEMQSSVSLHSTLEEEGTKQVHVVGHVSKPIFGEGRQTPDRQMFFVNSRPCGLPQVAKVMNEVYKSYNLNQSPFIFADVMLDTNAYDVNVSPDKRTILLHDQGALLESLRTSLTELFDNQQQTVPQSQRLTPNPTTNKKLPAFRSHSGTPASDRQFPGSRVEPPENSEERNDNGTMEMGQESTEESLREKDADRGATSLIHKFLIRNLRDRSSESGSDKSTKTDTNGRFSAVMGRMGVDHDTSQDQYWENMSSPEEEAHQPPSMSQKGPETPVCDFNRRLAEQAASSVNGGPSRLSSNGDGEEDVPTLGSTPSKQVDGVVPKAFDRMRPRRDPPEKATITIGDETITTQVGSQSMLQRWSKTTSKSHKPRSVERTTGNQQFASSMKAFAAPSTTPIHQNEKVEVEDDRDEDLNSDDEEVDDEVEDQRKATRTTSPEGQQATEECDEGHIKGKDKVNPFKMPLVPQKMRLPDFRAHFLGGRPSAGSVEGEDSDLTETLEGAASNDSDEDYLDEAGKKLKEEAKVAQLIRDAEERAARPTEDDKKRAESMLSGGGARDSTTDLLQKIRTSIQDIASQFDRYESLRQDSATPAPSGNLAATQDLKTTAEERLSLTVSKEDFFKMRIIGQFNLGFIIAAREPSPSSSSSSTSSSLTYELFIIDQHASDEKYNFERLQATTVVQNQPLVQPLPLDLTAVEEEIILENEDALLKNGFKIAVDQSGGAPIGQRCHLFSLPMSKEYTFSLQDLEELISLLSDSHITPASQRTQLSASNPSQPQRSSQTPTAITPPSVPRPSKVRKMFAMRACRSSVMIGKTLTQKQMERLVVKMGELDKPWNCPHGRPTMRHLCSLEGWQGWDEDDGVVGTQDESEDEELGWAGKFGCDGNGDIDWVGFLSGVDG